MKQDGGRPSVLAWALSAGAHVLVTAAIYGLLASRPPVPPRVAPLLVDLVELPSPAPPGPLAAPEREAAAPAEPARPPAAPAPAAAPVLDEVPAQTPGASDVLSESQLAGAASAGAADGSGRGGGGSGCDMAQAVQHALRRDPQVRAAVARADRLGKAVRLWDGDWVRAGTQDGKGLAVVRQAVMWELAFVPEACRDRPMRGLVLLSLADGATRFAIGADAWRWSDLLGLPGPPASSVEERPGVPQEIIP